MKSIQFLLSVFLYGFLFVNAADDSCKIQDILSCYVSVGLSSAEKSCSSVVCKNMTEMFDKCSINEILGLSSSQSSGNTGLTEMVSKISLLCVKKGGDYCYDKYMESVKNQVGKNATEADAISKEFSCSDCGSVLLDSFKESVKNYEGDKDSEEYKQFKEKVDAMDACNGVSFMTIFKFTNMLIIALIGLFFATQ